MCFSVQRIYNMPNDIQHASSSVVTLFELIHAPIDMPVHSRVWCVLFFFNNGSIRLCQRQFLLEFQIRTIWLQLNFIELRSSIELFYILHSIISNINWQTELHIYDKREMEIDYIGIYVYFILNRMRIPFHAEYHDIRRQLASH